MLPLAVPILTPDPSPFTNCESVAVIAVPPVTKPFVSYVTKDFPVEAVIGEFSFK